MTEKQDIARELSLAEYLFFVGIDGPEFQAIREKWEHATPTPIGQKFLQHPLYWVDVNLNRIFWSELHVGHKKRILDLGCGVGYFLFLCNVLGHDALGLDVDRSPIFRETIRLFGLSRTIFEIERFRPLPDLGAPFDVVTAHSVTFNGHKTDKLWQVDEWRYFLNDVGRLLKPEGELFVLMNREPDGRYLTPELWRFFESDLGAEVTRDGRSIHFRYARCRKTLAKAARKS